MGNQDGILIAHEVKDVKSINDGLWVISRKISLRLTAGTTLGPTGLPWPPLDRISKMSYIFLLKALGTAQGFAEQNEREAVTEFLRTHTA